MIIEIINFGGRRARKITDLETGKILCISVPVGDYCELYEEISNNIFIKIGTTGGGEYVGYNSL